MESKKAPKLSETDIAYQVLKENRAPMHYKDLIAIVLKQMGLDPSVPNPIVARVHTEINLDSRFNFLGKGLWGLTSWSPKTNRPVAPGLNERSYQPKPSDYAWEDDEDETVEEEEEACLVPDNPDEVEEEEEALDEDGFPLGIEEASEEEEEEEEEDPESRLRRFMKR